MKKIFTPFLLIFSICVNAQTDTSGIEPPDSTGFGIPDGKLVSKEIGVSGGTIFSEDGRVELIFPEGALTQNTAISIHPVTNMRKSSGKAYQLEPSGIQFKKPVKIIFHYTDEEAETCPPDLKSFALQDHKGKWSRLEYSEWDSIAKTLSGFIQHFSALVTDENDVLLTPQYPVVGVGAYTIIFIQHKNIIDTGEFRGEHDFAEFAGNRFGVFVNEDFGGNEQVGTILGGGSITSRLATAFGYTAPVILPKQNPVEIKLAFKYYSSKAKKIKWGKVKCKVTVFDMYNLLLVHEFTARGGLGSKLIDSASCIVEVYPDRVEIIRIKNYEPIVIKEGRQGPVREKIATAGASGTIHLTKVFRNYKLSRDYPPEVYFEPVTFKALWYKAQYCARGAPCSEFERIDEDTVTEEINFIANGKQQKIAFTIGHLDYDGNNTYKLVATPYRVVRQN